MTKNELASALAHVLNHHIVRIACCETWNGFHSGTTYEAAATFHHGRWVLGATDNHGILTPITESASSFFTLTEAVPAVPTEDERDSEAKRRLLDQLITASEYLMEDQHSYDRGARVVWRDGMCNRKFPSRLSAMIVIDQIEPRPASSAPGATGPNDIEMLDLRVAVVIESAREDENYVAEFIIDSRRVTEWVAP